jgi:hypothetical protein
VTVTTGDTRPGSSGAALPDDEVLLVEDRGAVRILVLNRPEKRRT